MTAEVVIAEAIGNHMCASERAYREHEVAARDVLAALAAAGYQIIRGDGPMTQQAADPALPPGFRILNDGPGREVLVRDEWEECPVFPTVAEAAARAWEIANER